jgi:ribA/ribD-fused uncharacterized protein
MDLNMKRVSKAEALAQDAIIDFDREYRFLSNFGAGGATMYAIEFPTIEHAFAAAKIDPKDPRHTTDPYAQMREIAALPTPGLAKRAGRKALMRTDWDEVKPQLVLELVRRKFADPELAKKLLATGDRPLYEGNTWGDRIWGVVENDGFLEGRNLLGEILMTVRAELRAAE